MLLLLLLFFSCNDTSMDETPQSEIIQDGENMQAQLNEVLNQLDLESGIIMVQNGGSIQEAINAAEAGNSIYIEPGTYKEALVVNKPDLKLIGLGNSPDEQVILENPGNATKAINLVNDRNSVEVVDIRFQDFKEKGTGVSLSNAARRGKRSCLLNMNRELIGNGIAHYEFDLRLGPNQFDVVRVHRVVRERRPYHPIRTKGDVQGEKLSKHIRQRPVREASGRPR